MPLSRIIDDLFCVGHDGLIHAVREDSMILCSMGRATPLEYRDSGPITCLACYRTCDMADYVYDRVYRINKAIDEE